MYNEKLKERFINECIQKEGRRKAAITMFNVLEPYEREWDSDICTKTKDEVYPVVGKIVGLRKTSASLRVSILHLYAKWCVDNNIDGARLDLLELNNDFGLEKIKHQMVANPMHLQRYLDLVFEPVSEGTINCIYRCYYWLAYSGMSEEDALNVKTSDVDLENMQVIFNDRKYPIYREAVPAMRNCIELTNCKIIFPNRESYMDRVNTDNLLRGLVTGNQRPMPDLFRWRMSKKNRELQAMIKEGKVNQSMDLKLSFYKVWLSGVFYRTYEGERSGIPVDFMSIAADRMEGKEYKLDSCRRLPISKQKELAKDYLDDYERWKEAYSI